MSRIALIEDQALLDDAFVRRFDQVDFLRSVAELGAATARGSTWDAAFVDFHLGAETVAGQTDGRSAARRAGPTGMSALIHLRQHHPSTKTIAFTTLGENGRTLYGIVAYHWLGAWAVVDKSVATDTLSTIARHLDHPAARPGYTPTRERLHRDLTTSGYLIDELLRDDHWIRYWPMLRDANYSYTNLMKLAGINKSQARDAVYGMGTAVDALQAAWFNDEGPHDRLGLYLRDANQGRLANFYGRNSLFLEAPDLSAAYRHKLMAGCRCSTTHRLRS